MYTYIHTYIHTYIYIYMQSDAQVVRIDRIHEHVHVCTYMYEHTYYFLGYTCMHMHTCTCILIFTHRAHLHRRGDPTSI